jgi:L-lactate permease
MDNTVLSSASLSKEEIMISPQSVTTGVSTTPLVGKEGLVVARTFKHSIIMAALPGLLVMAQQYLIPWIIPH